VQLHILIVCRHQQHTGLYDIDFEQSKLYLQNPPNDGGLEVVGDLTVDFEGQGDMDIFLARIILQL
jgi:hypothetical protein